MKRKQTHVRSKSSVTTSALVGAALVASLGAAAAGFASLDTQPSFKVANAGNPTSQPLGLEITSSTPYSFAEFSTMFDLSTTSPRELATVKSLMPGEILRLENGSATRLMYVSKKDGHAYQLGNSSNTALQQKWLAFAKNTKVRSIKSHVLYERVNDYFETKQGIKSIVYIPGNHLITYTSPTTKKTTHIFYGADKQFYQLTNTSKEATNLLSTNIQAIRISYINKYPPISSSNGADVVYLPNFNSNITSNNVKHPIYKLPTDVGEMEVYVANKNQAAATEKWHNDLQKLVESFSHQN